MIADGAWEGSVWRFPSTRAELEWKDGGLWDYFLTWPQGRLSYLNPKKMKPVKSEVVSILSAPHMDAWEKNRPPAVEV